jgi:nucleoside-diphosphate-sugar epimerase
VKTVLADGGEVLAFDLGDDRHRLDLVLEPGEVERVQFVRGDVTNLAAVERALDEHEITNVVHLAAMQVPFAAADPPRGALVNVVGTVTVFEAVKRRSERVPGIAYASSIAVYGPEDGTRVPESANGHPDTHYGVYKQANEGTARVYWESDGVPSVGLRPYVVFGPGRDQGLTAAPTLAMEAAARGEQYEIPFGGRMQFHYAPDVARAFVDAARSPGEGAAVDNLGGPSVHVGEVVRAIQAAAPGAAITFRDKPLPFPEEFEARTPARSTALDTAVRETIDHFRARL